MAKSAAYTERPKPAAPIDTPIDLPADAVSAVTEALNRLIADTFTLYVKTKNFHWHISGPHFRDYHLLLDDQARQIYATIDDLAERVRKLGGVTVHSVGEIQRLKRLKDNDEEYVAPLEMLRELMADNKAMIASMREAHETVADCNDFATTSLIEVFIDGAEKRNWFLFEASRHGDNPGY